MNIKEELLKYPVQPREQALRIAEYASESAEHFQELMNCFLSGDVQLAQRAAWSVSWAAQKNPMFVQPHIGLLVKQLERTDVHDAVIRNSIRALADLDIPQEFHGELLNACFDLVQKRETPIAIKALSLTILFKLSQIYKEIKNELRMIITQNMDYESAAFVSRGKKILKKL